MPNYRRCYQPGGSFFFTLVTARRSRILTQPLARRLLGQCVTQERRRRPFSIEAIVLLPDHLHTIWSLPRGDSDYSTRWKTIKGSFTHRWLKLGGSDQKTYSGQRKEARRGVWQPRFMEHTIRDEDDFIQHVEYIHYNPVKHGLAQCPHRWRWSSFHRYVAAGYYPQDWCCAETRAPPNWPQVDGSLLE